MSIIEFKNDYSNACIYEIRCKNPSIKATYIGGTKNLESRITQHFYNLTQKSKKQFYVYQFITDHGGWDNFEICLLEKVNCKNRQELSMREAEWINKYKPSLNKNIPCRTIKEYQLVNKDKLLKANQLSNKRHREKFNLRNRINYQKNKDKYRASVNKYLEKNRDKINARRKQKYRCLCGATIALSYRPAHIRSRNHKKNMENFFTKVDCKHNKN